MIHFIKEGQELRPWVNIMPNGVTLFIPTYKKRYLFKIKGFKFSRRTYTLEDDLANHLFQNELRQRNEARKDYDDMARANQINIQKIASLKGELADLKANMKGRVSKRQMQQAYMENEIYIGEENPRNKAGVRLWEEEGTNV